MPFPKLEQYLNLETTLCPLAYPQFLEQFLLVLLIWLLVDITVFYPD